MPQVAAQYPNLNQIFGESSVFPVQYGMQQFESAQNADKLNQDQALQDYLFNQQNNPTKLQRNVLENQQLDAQLPGIFADSSLKQDNADISRQSLGEQIAGKKSDISKKLSDNELSMIENHARQLAMSDDPNEREIGTELLKHHADVVKENAKQGFMTDRRLQEISASNAGQKDLEQMRIEAGKYKKTGRGTTDVIEKALVSGNYIGAANAYDRMAQQAAQEGDMETAQYYAAKTEEYRKLAYQQPQAGPGAVKPGQVDLNSLSKGSLPTLPQNQAPGAPMLPGQPNIQRDIQNGASFSSPEVEAQVRARAGLANVPTDLPQGTKSNGDGTFTLPNGKVIRKKQ